jgi:hypothetical protein
MAVVEHQDTLEPNSQNDGGDDAWMQDLTSEEKTGLQKEGLLDKDGKAKGPVPENHPTKLGRKVKEMGERLSKIDSLEDKLNQLMTMNQELSTRLQESRPATRTTEDADEVPEHIREVLPYVKKELSREQHETDTKNRKYYDDYVATVSKPREDVDKELHDAVVDELLTSNFRAYKKVTGDPSVDAQTNYDLAVARILKAQRAGKKTAPNVKGDRQNAPLGLSSGSANDLQPVKKAEPDEFARKFIRAIGAKDDDDWVQESLRSAK